MTGDVIPLHGDPHRDVTALLPWYAKGLLDDEDRTAVEAHLRTCTACQAELAEETRLQSILTLAATPSDVPAEVDQAWSNLQRHMGMRSPAPRATAGIWSTVRDQWQESASWLRLAVAAQFALLLLFGGVLFGGAFFSDLALKAHPAPAQYKTLSAAPATAPATANIIVMFRPETSERALRRILKACDARVVDGPTAAGAYMLRVPAARRTAIVAELGQQSEITLAQPVDAGWTP